MRKDFKIEDFYSKEWEKRICDLLRNSTISDPKHSRKKQEQAMQLAYLSYSSSKCEFSMTGEYQHPLALVAAARFIFLSFYWPAYDKAKVERTSRYEVLIPYREQKEGFVKYWIVPSGAVAGEEVVYLKHSLTIPRKKREKGSKADGGYGLTDMPFASHHVSSKPYKDKKFEGIPVRFEYGVATLEEEPLLRLPLHNVPLQCAYEMVRAAIGDAFNPPSRVEVWMRMRKGESEIKIERTPIKGDSERETLLCALLQYSLWRRLNLTDQQQLQFLIDGMRDQNLTCIYSEGSVIALRNRLHGIFAKQLERNQSSGRQ